MPDAETAAEFRNQVFQNFALPYYVVIQPKGRNLRQLGAYEKGLIGSPTEFIDFLQKARSGGQIETGETGGGLR